MKAKRFLIPTAGICAAVVLLMLVQMLLMPKYMSQSPEGTIVSEYYGYAGDNDVVFIGDCEVYENFSPITMWEEYGITSCIRGSAQQMIWQSYYLMEETFRYETPKVMVFNVLSMKYGDPAATGRPDQREAYNRMTLDGMRWSGSKWNAIQDSMTAMEREKGGMWLYLFPLLRYHDRWSDLTYEDFRYMFHREKITENGYLMQAGIKPVTGEHMEMPLVNYQFADSSYAYLDRMVELCEHYGTELVLIKAPSLSPVWWEQWDTQIQEYAQEHGLRYYNFLDDQEKIGIDWNTDTYDTGLHLNVYGAEKLSSFFGQILRDDLKLPDHRNDPVLAEQWSEKCDGYHARKIRLESNRDNKGERK